MKQLSDKRIQDINENIEKHNQVAPAAQNEFTRAAAKELLSMLPSELGEHIGDFLTRNDASKIVATCKKIKNTANDARRSFFQSKNITCHMNTDETLSYLPCNLPM